ncbi:MAG TPA: cytochrome c biogenesis CcdA family protein [Acidimicrobiales bacterium]|nr:cytochrome c biogenesis CcdA family protein [Acidimicrobiales bacterium]
MNSWLLYPFTLGLVAAVNPCGFPLLPVYLSLFIEGKEATPLPVITKVRRGLTAGVYATCGFVLLFGFIGILTEAGLSGTSNLTASWARYPLVLLGVALIVYGLVTLTGRRLNFHLPEIRPGLAQRRPLAIGLFGVSYGVASLGCSLPIFLGGVASSFTHRGFIHGIETFIAYALGMGLLLTIVALVMSLTELATVRRFRIFSPFVGPLGGVILITVGLYVTIYWVSAIVDPLGSNPVLTFVEGIQTHIATFVQDHASMLGGVLGVILLAVVLVMVLIGRPHRRREPHGESI